MADQDTHVAVQTGQNNKEEEINRADVHHGDLIFIETQNALYSIRVLENDEYMVSGGWFDRNRISPVKLSIAGCTWGGTTVNDKLIAACGLRTEFSNQVRTSQVRKIRFVAAGSTEPAEGYSDQDSTADEQVRE